MVNPYSHRTTPHPLVTEIASLLKTFMAVGTTSVAPPAPTSVALPEPPSRLLRPSKGGFVSDGTDWDAIIEAQ